MKHKKIAIIGAGFSSAILTNRLLQAGYQVTIFEKNRGVGGKFSSCRIGKDSADMGSPWFDPTTSEFKRWLSSRPEIIPWRLNHCDFSGNIQTPKSVFLSSPRQNSLIQNLIKGAMLCTESKVTKVYKDCSGIRILRNGEEQIKWFYDAAIITTPAPQAIGLLPEHSRLNHIASSTLTTSSWVVVITLKEKTGIIYDSISGPHSTLYRATRDSSKPRKNSWSRQEVWVLEATSEWSERHQASDQSTVGHALIKAFEKVIKRAVETSHTRIYHWLHARHKPVSREKFLWDQAENIGICCDWLEYQDTEGAWISANALANQLISSAKTSHLYDLQKIKLIPSRT